MKILFSKGKSLAIILTVLTTVSPINIPCISALKDLKTSEISCKLSSNIHGFSLKKDLSIDGHNILAYQHDKSGAWLIVEKNNNLNKKFEISVRTPPENDKGINHIIEHCILNGSKEYPCKSMIWELSKIAHANSMNGMTYPCYTSFPVSSTDEDELESLAKIYSSGVFHPSFLSDEKIFKKEGIRFELDNKENLIPNGTVFNEMQKGSQGNIISQLIKNVFPDTQGKNFSGGMPEKIMDLTYDEVCQTYKKYYHPTNMVIYMSGNINYEKFMQWIDRDYLQGYNKKDFKGVTYLSQDPKKISKLNLEKYYQPETNKKTKVASVTHILDWETYNKNIESIHIICSVLNNPNSNQSKFIKEKGCTVNASCNQVFYDPLLEISFSFKDSELVTPEKIHNILTETFAKYPITQSEINANKNSRKFDDKLSFISRMYDKNLNSKCFINSFIRFNDPCSDKYFLTEKPKKSVMETVNDIFLKKDYITTIFEPSTDMSLNNSSKIKEKIKSLTPQKKILTKNYKEQKKWAESPNKPEDLEKIEKMFKKLSDINTPVFSCPLDIQKLENKDYYYTSQDIGDFISYKFVFNANKISDEEKKIRSSADKFYKFK